MLTLAITTQSETAERIADPLARRGIDVRHLPTTGRAMSLTGAPLPLEGSPDDPETTPPGSEEGNDAEAIADPLGAFDVGFVYPSRLTEGGVLDALIDLPWVNDRAAVLTSRNKAGVLAALGRENIPVPETVLCADPMNESILVDVFERFEPPVVIKPNSATRGIGITIVSDLDSFLWVCDYLGLILEFPTSEDKSFLVQEYLPDARDYRVMVLDGECVGAVERQGAGWKHNVHRGAAAVGVSVPTAVADLTERVADVLDVSYLGVDVLVSGERTLVTETNARPTIDDASKYREGFYDDLAALIRAAAT
jgi:ribosomal protein S6--L-glutamate ligase